ncbi:MAG TPA: glucuronate isomerase [Candidatus Hydrogenedens sp.]|nr:glucuronate isomerase [Candidatus Hydrogenedens sp.]HPP58826.1 glucuronate isomerase [Candidatus Hydrogenedens sp.]
MSEQLHNEQPLQTHELTKVIKTIFDETPITDIHTHLFSPSFGTLLLWGIDELLTYHYLVAEFFRTTEIPYSSFWNMSKKEQAQLIWQALFIDRTPISEACRGVLTVLNRLGLDTTEKDLNAYREWFSQQTLSDHVNHVFQVANLKTVVMTNDPFDPIERDYWMSSMELDSRFLTSLRLDTLILRWIETYPLLQSLGYSVDANLTEETLSEIRRFVSDWIQKIKPVYVAVSLPPQFDFPEHSHRGIILEQAILPVARFFNIPLALMLGVTRSVNPELKLAGDSVGMASLRPIESLCEKYPQNKFMFTMLSRENMHSACVTARKFRNLMPFGCWWFLNNPSLIEEITTMRIELLGTTFIPQHSDARVLEQVIYKWEHTRNILLKVLTEQYGKIVATGWKVTPSDVKRDISNWFGGNFWKFLESKF